MFYASILVIVLWGGFSVTPKLIPVTFGHRSHERVAYDNLCRVFFCLFAYLFIWKTLRKYTWRDQCKITCDSRISVLKRQYMYDNLTLITTDVIFWSCTDCRCGFIQRSRAEHSDWPICCSFDDSCRCRWKCTLVETDVIRTGDMIRV